MSQVQGYHVFWSAPKVKRKQILMHNFELFVLALSANIYRNVSKSKITFYTDSTGLEFIKKNKIATIWNKIDTDLIQDFVSHFSDLPPQGYENAGKAYIEAVHDTPYLYIDNDVILSESIPEKICKYDMAYAHLELFDGSPKKYKHNYEKFKMGYPDPDKYTIPLGYKFNKNFDWNSKFIFNTSLLYLNNNKLKESYQKELFAFLKGNTVPKDIRYRTAQFIFLDQRLLGLIAEKNYKCISLLNKYWDLNTGYFYIEKNRPNMPYISKYHHTWLMKKFIAQSKVVETEYIRQILNNYKDQTDKSFLKSLVKNFGYEDIYRRVLKNEK